MEPPMMKMVGPMETNAEPMSDGEGRGGIGVRKFFFFWVLGFWWRV